MDLIFDLIAELFGLVVKAGVAVGALGWLALMGFAQWNCSIIPHIGHRCDGPDYDIWMLPFFTAILGLPATWFFVGFIRKALRR
jgi:hypothetical protein